MTELLKTPLHDWHATHGGRMVEFGGWSMPVQYSSIVEEHHAVRKGVGLFDISHMGRLRFTGTDACRFLDHLLTNDVSKLQVGQVRYALVCREDGGILDDVLVYRLPDAYWLVVNASNRLKIVDWITQQQTGFSIDWEDLTLSTGMIAIQGPQTSSALPGRRAELWQKLKYYGVIDATEAGSSLEFISRTGYTGEDGCELIVQADQLPMVWERLLATAVEKGIDLQPCGLGARDTLRLEAAMPLYGHELSEAIDPLTAGLGFAVKLDKPEFMGRTALVDISRRNDPRIRVGLLLAGRRIAREGSGVFAGEQSVGEVTSGTFSPTLEKSIAMAYVSRSGSATGTELEVDVRGKREAATVVGLPFYRRSSAK